MDRFERVRRLRDEYEAALDEAERLRAQYHREVVKLYRSGVSLREIAEHLGVSHQRVHQIVGVSEPRRSRRRGVTGTVGAALVLLVGTGLLLTRSLGPPQEGSGDAQTKLSDVALTIAPSGGQLPGCGKELSRSSTVDAASDPEDRSAQRRCGEIFLDARAVANVASYAVATDPLFSFGLHSAMRDNAPALRRSARVG